MNKAEKRIEYLAAKLYSRDYDGIKFSCLDDSQRSGYLKEAKEWITQLNNFRKDKGECMR